MTSEPAVPGESDGTPMTGAHALVASLAGAGVDVCFMNPGTSELHFVQCLDLVPAMRGVLGLFEGVATGAADGYARMTGRPAAVLLHLGPGLANGLANLHNARRARSPVVCIVGAHATGHVRYDAPLQSDIEAMARTVSGWVTTSGTTRDLPGDAMRAVQASGRDGGQVATLVLPADVSWSTGAAVAAPRPAASPDPVPESAVAAAAAGMAGGGDRDRVTLLLGGRALTERGLRAAGRIAAGTGARLLAETHPARMECGGGLPPVTRLAYPAERAAAQLAGTGRLILAGARPPVSFFAYPDRDSDLVPGGCLVTRLAEPGQDAGSALERLAELVAAQPGPQAEPVPGPQAGPVGEPAGRPPGAAPVEPGPLTLRSLAAAVAATLPEHAIVVDEANTSGAGLPRALAGAPRHSLLTLTGGAIGQGLPVATGAAVAAPDRRVVCLEADGSALYTIQALWTQARERLDVTTVVLSNGGYAVLRVELGNFGIAPAGERAARMFSLDDPAPDFVRIGQGFGVPSCRATTGDELVAALRRAHAVSGPHLIEAVVPPVA